MGLMATAQAFGIVLIGMEWMNDQNLTAWAHIDPKAAPVNAWLATQV